jgi:hypothetical protein
MCGIKGLYSTARITLKGQSTVVATSGTCFQNQQHTSKYVTRNIKARSHNKFCGGKNTFLTIPRTERDFLAKQH